MKPASDRTVKIRKSLAEKAARETWNKLCSENNLPVREEEKV